MPSPFPAPLQSLPASVLDLLGERLEQVTFAPEEEIFAAGDPGDSCLFIDSGVVRLELPMDHVDNDVTLGYLDAGDILGELAILDDEPRSANAIAETEVTARRLSTDTLEALTNDSPLVAARVLRALGADAAAKVRAGNVRLAEVLAVETSDEEVEDLVARAKAAQASILDLDDEVIDAALADLADAFAEAAEPLAKEAVAQTKLGNVTDKTIKNTFAARGVAAHLGQGIGVGPLGPPVNDVTEVAAPVGVIFAIVPVTNPAATAVFKILSALKTRNAVIMSLHRVCLELAEQIGQIAHEVLERHGLPTDLVLWIRKRAGRVKTNQFMRHPDVSLILATGGPGMVKAAYSSGTPAIGVGPGNAPCWVAPDASLEHAANAIVASKSFDNGLICGAEHNLIADASIRDDLVTALEGQGAAVLDAEETSRFLAAALKEDGSGWRPEVFGQSAALMASMIEVERPFDIRVLVFPGEPDLASPVTSEKMSPFLSLFTVDGEEEALALASALLGKMGAGHTAIVHTTSEERAARFGAVIPASRILVNSPGSQGVCGLTTALKPSLTLGCGTFGGNSTGDNVTYENLRNIKRIAGYVEPDPELVGG